MNGVENWSHLRSTTGANGLHPSVKGSWRFKDLESDDLVIERLLRVGNRDWFGACPVFLVSYSIVDICIFIVVVFKSQGGR